jgi:hypothetical protein
MIIALENCLDKESCDYLINVFKTNKDIHEKHGLSSLLRIKKISNIEQNNYTNKISRYIHNLVIKHTGYLLYPDNIQIVCKPSESGQKLHKDFQTSKFTSITFLNSLDSGETFFEDFGSVKPRIGRTIIFNGNELPHGSKITREDRYTFICWYSEDPNRLEI